MVVDVSVRDEGLGVEHARSEGLCSVRETVPVKPNRLVTVTVNAVDCPAGIVIGFGVAKRVNVGGGLSTDIVVVWIRPPLLATTVTVAGSGLGALLRLIVRTELPEPPVMVLGEKLVVSPASAFADRVTVPVKPLMGDTVMVAQVVEQ